MLPVFTILISLTAPIVGFVSDKSLWPVSKFKKPKDSGFKGVSAIILLPSSVKRLSPSSKCICVGATPSNTMLEVSSNIFSPLSKLIKSEPFSNRKAFWTLDTSAIEPAPTPALAKAIGSPTLYFEPGTSIRKSLIPPLPVASISKAADEPDPPELASASSCV